MVGPVLLGGLRMSFECTQFTNLHRYSFPGGISGTLAGPDSGVRTFHREFQWKARASPGPARVPEMPHGLEASYYSQEVAGKFYRL